MTLLACDHPACVLTLAEIIFVMSQYFRLLCHCVDICLEAEWMRQKTSVHSSVSSTNRNAKERWN